MTRSEKKLVWWVIALTAAAVFVYEYLFMPLGAIKVAVCVVALAVIGLAWFNLRHRRRHRT